MESSKKARRGTTRRLTRVLGGVPVEDLGARHLEAFRDQGGAALTLRAALKDLRSAWRWSRSRGWINRELATIALPEARPTSERHTPTLAEAEQIGAQLQGSRRAAYELIFATGCRGIAMIRLRWQDINWVTSKVRLCGKGKKWRTVPVPERVIEALHELRESCGRPESGRVFEGVHFRCLLGRQLGRICAALGVARFTLHALRRLRAREFRRKGVAVRVAASYLGHSPQMMLRVYDEASEEDLEAAMKACFEGER